MSERRFPIMAPDADTHEARQLFKTLPPFPSSIPWAMVAPHERQAMANHSQTLSRLAERGGLDLHEIDYILSDQPIQWHELGPGKTPERAFELLREKIELLQKRLKEFEDGNDASRR